MVLSKCLSCVQPVLPYAEALVSAYLALLPVQRRYSYSHRGESGRMVLSKCLLASSQCFHIQRLCFSIFALIPGTANAKLFIEVRV